MLGSIYRGARTRSPNASHLKTRIVDYIDKENWSAAGADVNGDAYEEPLERSAGDTKSTVSTVLHRAPDPGKAMVEVVQPTTMTRWIIRPGGTGGFLLAAHAYVSRDAASYTPPQRGGTDFVTGVDIRHYLAPGIRRTSSLHGLGPLTGES